MKKPALMSWVMKLSLLNYTEQLHCVGSLSKASKTFLELIMELQVM